MARIRTVKPDFFEDEAIGVLSREARLLFVGSWTQADDEGLLRWTPTYIKSTLFMYDDDLDERAVEQAMVELKKGYHIQTYLGGRLRSPLAWIVKFRSHQRINRPQPGKLPPPGLHSPVVYHAYYRRDGGNCGLCGAEVPSGYSQLQRNRGSLDHIIPRSKGGSDYPSNIQLAHQSCNSAKCNRSERSLLYPVNDSVSDSVNGSLPEGNGMEVEKEKEGIYGPDESGPEDQTPATDLSDWAKRLAEKSPWGAEA